MNCSINQASFSVTQKPMFGVFGSLAKPRVSCGIEREIGVFGATFVKGRDCATRFFHAIQLCVARSQMRIHVNRWISPTLVYFDGFVIVAQQVVCLGKDLVVIVRCERIVRQGLVKELDAIVGFS